MRALSLLCLLACISPPLLAADLDGRYQGTLDERPVELVLRSQGQQVEGEYIEDQDDPSTGADDGVVGLSVLLGARARWRHRARLGDEIDAGAGLGELCPDLDRHLDEAFGGRQPDRQ